MRQYRSYHVMLLLTVKVVLSAQNCSHIKPAHYTPQQVCVFYSQPRADAVLFPYKQCQYDERRKRWWCPTSVNYCTDRMYKWCPRTKSTYGGTSPGHLCHFPFTYLGKSYAHCTKDGTPRLRSYYWCATREYYDEKHWTRCDVGETDNIPCVFRSDGVGIEKACSFFNGAWHCRTEAGMLKKCESTEHSEGGNDPGRACHFPFYLHGTQMFECQKGNVDVDTYEWCATTDNYDRDQLWTRCKRHTVFLLQGLPLVIVIICASLFTIVAGLCASHYLWKTVYNIFSRSPLQDGSSHEEISCNKEEDVEEVYDDEDDNVSQRRVASADPNISPPSYEEVLHCNELVRIPINNVTEDSHIHTHNFTSNCEEETRSPRPSVIPNITRDNHHVSNATM